MNERVTTLRHVRDRLVSSGFAVSEVGALDTAVTGMSHDSRAVRDGQLFVCLRGDAFDGHEFAEAAQQSGASALLVDHEVASELPQLIVDDTRRAAGPAASAAWSDPSRQLVMIGITGTNGKTTTSQIVAALLEGAGLPTGVIGTLHGPRTTPEAADLHATLAEFVDSGRRAVVMEVSSHALALHRVDGTDFDVVGFTNLGHDHLDLHGTHENYFRAKSALFNTDFAPVAVINVDDPHGRLLADAVGADDEEDGMQVVELTVTDLDGVEIESQRHAYNWRGRSIEVPLGGSFNVANSLLAVAMIAELDADVSAALGGLRSLTPIPGRFESVETDDASSRGARVIVDYAHTPDGLEHLIEAVRPLTEERVIVVFGCAGRRDREKRPVMGEIAGRLADVAIATSDNPRGEDPDEIINDVIGGVAEQYRSRVIPEPDRRLAIRTALSMATRGDIVVIAGKGHEQTQDLGATTIDFDDRVVAREELAALTTDVPGGQQ